MKNIYFKEQHGLLISSQWEQLSVALSDEFPQFAEGEVGTILKIKPNTIKSKTHREKLTVKRQAKPQSAVTIICVILRHIFKNCLIFGL